MSNRRSDSGALRGKLVWIVRDSVTSGNVASGSTGDDGVVLLGDGSFQPLKSLAMLKKRTRRDSELIG